MEDKELQELEEFTLEDIIREFSDHPVEEVSVELSEEAPATAPEEEISEEQAEAEQEEPEEEIPQQTQEELPAEEAPVCPEETLTEDTVALDEDFVAQFQKGLPDLTGDTIRLDEEALEEIREAALKAAQPALEVEPFQETVSFDDFCRYVLPYRAENEAVCKIRKQLMDTYIPLLDSAGVQSVDDACRIINGRLKSELRFSETGHPLKSTLEETLRARTGACDALCNYMIYVMRAVGLPIVRHFFFLLVRRPTVCVFRS